MAIWTKICAHSSVNLACLEYSRQVFVGNTDAGICFSVFKQNVVSGIPFLYQVVLKQKSVFFCFNHNILDIPDFAHKNRRFPALVFFAEIRIHPTLQVFGFSHIDNSTGFIKILITARTFWKVKHNVLKLRFNLFFLISCFCFLHILTNKLWKNKKNPQRADFKFVSRFQSQHHRQIGLFHAVLQFLVQ